MTDITNNQAFKSAKRAVVQVGAGRGFVVSAGNARYIITAAHCLPHYPKPHLANSVSELTYPKIIGKLTSRQPTIWAELCAISYTDDLAVFSEPDGQALYDECAEYDKFTKTAMPIGKSPDALAPHLWESHPGSPAFMLSLDGEWQSCTLYNGGRFLVIHDGAASIKSGMSGSPLVDANGAAIGLISTGGASGNKNPSLLDCLPPWLLHKLDMRPRLARATVAAENFIVALKKANLNKLQRTSATQSLIIFRLYDDEASTEGQ